MTRDEGIWRNKGNVEERGERESEGMTQMV